MDWACQSKVRARWTSSVLRTLAGRVESSTTHQNRALISCPSSTPTNISQVSRLTVQPMYWRPTWVVTFVTLGASVRRRDANTKPTLSDTSHQPAVSAHIVSLLRSSIYRTEPSCCPNVPELLVRIGATGILAGNPFTVPVG